MGVMGEASVHLLRDAGDDQALAVRRTSRGWVTLKRELLEHLGVRPGDRLTVNLWPSPEGGFQAAARNSLNAIFASLLDNDHRATIEQMNQVIEEE